MIELPYYVWVGLGVIAGVILLYWTCLRVATNDWIGAIPPGPTQVPYFGCLFHLVSMKTSLDAFLSRYFLQFGAVVKFSICGCRIVLVDDDQDLENNPLLENNTFWYLVDLFDSLGLNITWSEELLKKCEDILETMMSYKMPMRDFMALMEDIEKYHLAQESKKIEKLLSECCSKSQVVLDSVDAAVIEECSREMELFYCTLRESPKIFLPFFRHFPWFMLHRKRVYERLLKVQHKLDEIFDKKVQKSVSSDIKELFFVMFMLFKHCVPSQSESKSKTKTQIKISGIQVFKTKDYLKIHSFDIPNKSWIISYKKI